MSRNPFVRACVWCPGRIGVRVKTIVYKTSPCIQCELPVYKDKRMRWLCPLCAKHLYACTDCVDGCGWPDNGSWDQPCADCARVTGLPAGLECDGRAPLAAAIRGCPRALADE